MRGPIAYNTIMENFNNDKGFQNSQGEQENQNDQSGDGNFFPSPSPTFNSLNKEASLDYLRQLVQGMNLGQDGQDSQQHQENEGYCDNTESAVGVVSDEEIEETALTVKNNLNSKIELAEIYYALKNNQSHPKKYILDDAIEKVKHLSIARNKCKNNVMADVLSLDSKIRGSLDRGTDNFNSEEENRIAKKALFECWCEHVGDDTLLYKSQKQIEKMDKTKRGAVANCMDKHATPDFIKKIKTKKGKYEEAHHFQMHCAGNIKGFFVKYRTWLIVAAIILLIVLIVIKFAEQIFGVDQFGNPQYGIYGV